MLVLSLLFSACAQQDRVDDEENVSRGDIVYEDVQQDEVETKTASEGLTFELAKNDPSYIVTGIGNCTDEVLYIPETYDGLPVKKIANKAFKNCTSFSAVVIPDSVEWIGYEAFAWCSSLKSVVMSKNIKDICNSAFVWCDFSSIELPDGMYSIGDNAFQGCTSLKSVRIPTGLTRIADMCFADCRSLESVEIPEGIKILGSGAFKNCKSLGAVTLPNSLQEMRGGFMDCDSLKSITIPRNVVEVYGYEFSGCSNLQTIECYADIDLSSYDFADLIDYH